MKTQDAIDHYDGSVAKLAEALDISRAAIYQWGDEVPALRAFQISMLTNGAVPMDGGATFEQKRKAAV